VRVAARTEVAASPDVVWAFVSNPARYLEFMSGITRWEVTGEHARGVGARYRMLMQVGSAEVGGLVEVVEWQDRRDIAWTSVTGLDQRGRWRLRERSDGGTAVELRLAYGVAGAGLTGWLAERIAARTVERNLRQSVTRLTRMVEQERLRRRAAERRTARVP